MKHEFLREFNLEFMPEIQLISAPCILGLKPNGVQYMAESLLASGLAETLESLNPIMHLPTFNSTYSNKRDPLTDCINTEGIVDFSSVLKDMVSTVLKQGHFPIVLGGDCSIIMGIMLSLKRRGTYGLLYMDAHADFYEPQKSVTGEVADMALAILTGRGPESLTDINNLKPYVNDENVVHVGQRDWAETKKYGSQDIRDTAIECISLDEVERQSTHITLQKVLTKLQNSMTQGFWIHYDTDVLSHSINPAVDYRLPGGFSFETVEYLIQNFLLTRKVIGMSITIFNPLLDTEGAIARNISANIGRCFFKH